MRVRRRPVEGGQRTRLTAAAADRLEDLARQWRPVPGADRGPVLLDDTGPVGDASTSWQAVAPAAVRDPPGRVALGPWTGSALRGLALLLAIAIALSAWWWWSGRPRAVAMAPTTLATGAAMAYGPAPALGAVPAASSAPSAPSTPDPDGAASAGTTPTMPAAQVVVHVAGLVTRPGLVTLPVGSRVADAVAAAGGVTRRRAADSVNLARILVDGEQIVVTDQPAAASVTAGGVTSVITDLNTADAAALDLLPGVGPVLAGRIVAWRAANGPFRSVDELGEVSGIGDAILEQLRPMVRV